MNAPLAARLPLEVLHDVGDVDRRPVDPRLDERAIEQTARRPDERTPRQILFVPRLLAHEHHARVTRAFAEHGLRPTLVELARGAARSDLPQLRQCRSRRDQRRGGIDDLLSLPHARPAVQAMCQAARGLSPALHL